MSLSVIWRNEGSVVTVPGTGDLLGSSPACRGASTVGGFSCHFCLGHPHSLFVLDTSSSGVICLVQVLAQAVLSAQCTLPTNFPTPLSCHPQDNSCSVLQDAGRVFV